MTDTPLTDTVRRRYAQGYRGFFEDMEQLERQLAEALNENDALAKDYLEIGRRLEAVERQLAEWRKP